MSRHPFGWSLPPGVSPGDLPGEQPYPDEDFEALVDRIYEEVEDPAELERWLDSRKENPSP